MGEVNCVISVTNTEHNIPFEYCYYIKEIKEILDSAEIPYKIIDTMAGWYNLNQNWLEFKIKIDTSWGPVALSGLSLYAQEKIYEYLSYGKIVMMVHYIEEDGSLTPHH